MCGVQRVVGPHHGVFAHGVQLLFEVEVVHAEHDVAVHLEQTPVGIPRESWVPCQTREALDRLIVQTQVEDRVHHAGHAPARARADRQQQGVVRVAESAAHARLQQRERLIDRGVDVVRDAPRLPIVAQADIGRDREPSRNRDADSCHLCQRRPFAAKHDAVGLGGIDLTVSKRKYVRCSHVVLQMLSR